MNERTVIITNTTRTDATITSLAFKDGRQFTLCGRQYEPFTLKPGEARAIPVCTIAQESGRHIDSLIFKTRGELRIFDISLIVYILGCRVSIDGGGQRPNGNTSGTAPLAAAGIDRPLVNVGEEIALSANVTGNFAPFTYQWTVTGGHIKDYNESWTTAYSTTPMAAADYKQPTIDFYWMQVGAYTVTVKATNSLGFTCTATTNWSVERNATDVNRVAEAFYSFNHSSKVLVQHSAWHGAHPLMGCSGAGYAFKTFHRAYMDRFNSWRATFGYPALAAWNPATPLPGGVSNAHVSRAAVYNPAAGVLPSYLTVAGGALSSPCFGVTSKPAFPSANALWVDIERFHNGVHGAIGGVSGDMSYIGRAPKDPIFWRYHSWVDTLG